MINRRNACFLFLLAISSSTFYIFRLNEQPRQLEDPQNFPPMSLPNDPKPSNFDRLSKFDDPHLDEMLVDIMGIENGEAELYRRKDAYLEFGFGVKGDQGGIAVLAKLMPNNRLKVIWAGQDIPSCAVLTENEVPVELEADCFSDGNIIKRQGTGLSN